MTRHHFIIIASPGEWERLAFERALMAHYPDFEAQPGMRTRISVVIDAPTQAHDFVFDYQELFDNSYWRMVDLRGDKPRVELHRPQYVVVDGRPEFVDLEWEFIVGPLAHPALQAKLRRWAADSHRQLSVAVGFDDAQRSESVAIKLRRRLGASVRVEVVSRDPAAEALRREEMMQMAKYLHYFYEASFRLRHVPTELPEEEVNRAWSAITDEKLKLSSLYNVMSIPVKMEILGHDRSDWKAFYALTASEIDSLTAVEHNRWCVERLLQGMRPCTPAERAEIEDDMRRRLADPDYARANPVSLKRRYKDERGAHFDLCAFSELSVDESGLPVTRYDRDLTAAIPLIVNAFNSRHRNG